MTNINNSVSERMTHSHLPVTGNHRLIDSSNIAQIKAWRRQRAARWTSTSRSCSRFIYRRCTRRRRPISKCVDREMKMREMCLSFIHSFVRHELKHNRSRSTSRAGVAAAADRSVDGRRPALPRQHDPNYSTLDLFCSVFPFFFFFLFQIMRSMVNVNYLVVRCDA